MAIFSAKHEDNPRWKTQLLTYTADREVLGILILSGQGKERWKILLWRGFMNKDVVFHYKQSKISESYVENCCQPS